MKMNKTIDWLWHILYLLSVMFKILMAIVIYTFLMRSNALVWNILMTLLTGGYLTREIFLFVTLNKSLQNGRY